MNAPQATTNTPGAFRRTLGALGLLGFTLSAMSPAASLFISGSGVLHLAGTGAAIAISIGAVLAFIAAILYAEVASNVPHAGGMYAGIAYLLGSWAGFVTLCLSLLAAPVYLAFSGVGLAEYVGFLMPGVPHPAIAATAIALSALLAVLDLRASAVITSAMLLLELLAIAVVSLVAASHPALPIASLARPIFLTHHGDLAPVPGVQLAVASIAGAFACAGALWGTYLGEDVRQDAREFGRTLMISGLTGALVVAVPLILVVLAIDDPKSLLSSEAPLLALIERHAGHGWAIAVSMGVSLAIFNNLATMTIALGRLLFATGRDSIWPASVNRLLTNTGKFGSPWTATLILVLVAIPLVFLPVAILLIALSAELFSPMLVALAVLVGRHRSKSSSGFLAPFHPLLPIVGLGIASMFLLATWLDPNAGRTTILVMMGTVLIATVYWKFGSRPRSQ